MKKILKNSTSALAVMSLSLIAVTSSEAANIAANYSDGDTITSEVLVGTGDVWQINGGTLTVGTGGTVNVLSTSASTNTTIGNGGTASMIIDGGALIFDGPASVLLGNSSSGNGTIELLSGSLDSTPGGSFFIGRSAGSDGTVIIRGGTATIGILPTFNDAGGTSGSIDFADKASGGSSDGTLTVTGADEAYYTGLYSAGTLTFNGANTDAFVDNFTVFGSTLSVVPEPSSTALLGLGGLALILRRRK